MERVNESFSTRLIKYISIFRLAVDFVDTRKRLCLTFWIFNIFFKRMKL